MYKQLQHYFYSEATKMQNKGIQSFVAMKVNKRTSVYLALGAKSRIQVTFKIMDTLKLVLKSTTSRYS